MTVKPRIIVDECVSNRMLSYLVLRGQTQVTCIRDGSSDDDIKRMANERNAYIITRDRDFLDYPRALIVGVGEPVKNVYNNLLGLFERNEMQNREMHERAFSRR